MSEVRPAGAAPGPFDVTQVRSGDRYELSRGHPIYVAPTGGAGARGTVLGAEVLETDPAVETAGIDAGYALAADTLRAPDVAVGNVPDAPGWIAGVPPLAVEYAGTGQHEGDLQDKIGELLAAGTRWIWVARLVGPRRVEVYEAGQPVRTVVVGEELHAPGVLANPVPVAALFDRAAAHAATLRNLLQRAGYASLDAVREQGRAEGREAGRAAGREEGERAGLIEAIEALCLAFDVELTPARRAAIVTLDAAALRVRLRQVRDDRAWRD